MSKKFIYHCLVCNATGPWKDREQHECPKKQFELREELLPLFFLPDLSVQLLHERAKRVELQAKIAQLEDDLVNERQKNKAAVPGGEAQDADLLAEHEHTEEKALQEAAVRSRLHAETLLGHYQESQPVAVRYIQECIVNLVGGELLEPGTLLVVSGLRIYEQDEGVPKHVITCLEGGGWLGFLDAGKTVNIGRKEDAK